MKTDTITNDISAPGDDFQCHWCHKPIEPGEEYWHSFNFDYICCTKVCIENAVERAVADQEAQDEANWEEPDEAYCVPYERSVDRLRAINNSWRY